MKVDERIKAFWVGIFFIVALILTAALFLFLHPVVGDGAKTLRVRFANIESIKPGTRVTYAGKPVGAVTEINELWDARNDKVDANGSPYFYEVVMDVDSHVKLYDSDEITLSSTGLMGEKNIAIVPKVAAHSHQLGEESVIYGGSNDRIEQALTEIAKMSGSLQCASDQITVFFRELNNQRFVEKTTRTFETVNVAMSKLERLSERVNNTVDYLQSGQGTLGQLLYNDCFYTKLSSVLSQFETTLSTINRYGILFQFSGRWQKENMRKRVSCASPCDMNRFLINELNSISFSLNRIENLMQNQMCSDMKMENPCLAEDVQLLLNKLQILEATLRGCN